MNKQTPGPLNVKGPHIMALDHPGKPARAVALVAGPNRVDRIPEREANRALIAAAYTAFDTAGRELGVDATTLARSVNIAALIRAAREVVIEPSATTPGIQKLARVLNAHGIDYAGS